MDLPDRTGSSSTFCIADVFSGISGSLLRITTKNEHIQEKRISVYAHFSCLFCFWIVRHLVTVKNFFSIRRRDGHGSEKFTGYLIQFFSGWTGDIVQCHIRVRPVGDDSFSFVIKNPWLFYRRMRCQFLWNRKITDL